MMLRIPPLNLRLDSLFLYQDGTKIIPDIRILSQMKEVIFDKDFLKNADPEMKLYFMYRGVTDKKDLEIFSKNNIRYDITVIPAMLLGMEFNKTAGHYHPKANGLEYPEIYEVIEGEAHYLIQKMVKGILRDVAVIKAKAGDKVIMPPGYGHITINPSSKTLVMSNLICPSFSSVYEPVKESHGGAYFELSNGKLIKNENYRDIPEIRILKAVKIKAMDENLYQAFINNPSIFEFLKKPELTPDFK